MMYLTVHNAEFGTRPVVENPSGYKCHDEVILIMSAVFMFCFFYFYIILQSLTFLGQG